MAAAALTASMPFHAVRVRFFIERSDQNHGQSPSRQGRGGSPARGGLYPYQRSARTVDFDRARGLGARHVALPHASAGPNRVRDDRGAGRRAAHRSVVALAPREGGQAACSVAAQANDTAAGEEIDGRRRARRPAFGVGSSPPPGRAAFVIPWSREIFTIFEKLQQVFENRQVDWSVRSSSRRRSAAECEKE